MNKENIKLEKHVVCKDCLSVSITSNDCRCTYSNNYPTITLEFEVCKCCNNIINDGHPSDTEFNKQQFDKLKNYEH